MCEELAAGGGVRTAHFAVGGCGRSRRRTESADTRGPARRRIALRSRRHDAGTFRPPPRAIGAVAAGIESHRAEKTVPVKLPCEGGRPAGGHGIASLGLMACPGRPGRLPAIRSAQRPARLTSAAAHSGRRRPCEYRER